MSRFYWGLLFSGIVHLGVFAATYQLALTQPTVEITTGETRVQVVFQERMPKEIPKPIPEETIALEKEETQKEIEAKPEAKKEELTITPSVEAEGAEWREVDYYQNPPPVYPLVAILRNMQGRVTVWGQVSELGDPQEVKVVESSGYPLLDQAALEAVWKWKFSPARIGRIAIKSQVRIPIHFRIVERK